MVNEQDKAKATIKVTVTFPLGEGPYHDDVPPDTTVGDVRSAAMRGFGVTEDPALVFYLIHAGDRIDDGRTIGDVAGHAAAVKFTLAREIIQGA